MTQIRLISYLESINDGKTIAKDIDALISLIRGQQFREIVAKIRSEDQDKKNKLKKNLPQFFPTIFLGGHNKLTESSQPTGIVQFDIDKKDNTEIDFTELKNKVASIPECLYSFSSPSGGLKFGILTDFRKNENDDVATLKSRYKAAYRIARDYVASMISVVFDDAVSAIKFPCYISYDPDVHINNSCNKLTLNEKCQAKIENTISQADISVSDNEIREILQYIPRDLKFSQRLPINFSVFKCIGSQGIQILFDHWITENRHKLLQDLHDQCQTARYGGIGQLISIAINYGFRQPTGKGRTNLRALKLDHRFPPLLSAADSIHEMNSAIKAFLEEKNSTYLNVSTGLGKTKQVLEILRHLPWTVKVLYLVRNHALAEEIAARFREIPVIKSTARPGIKISQVAHIKGKELTCERPDYVERFKVAGVLMPVDLCINCQFNAHCRYTLQFNEYENIRLMTHDELTNSPSAWFYGPSWDGKPRKTGWRPDFIIVDEDCLRVAEAFEPLTSQHSSLRNIINDVLNNTSSLTDAIINNSERILDDYLSEINIKPKKIEFKSIEDYISKSKNGRSASQSIILKALRNYLISNDEDFLKGLRVSDKRLILSTIKPVAERYREIPTLYLDATADQKSVGAALPEVRFISIKTKASEDSNVYQLENTTVTKKSLSDPEYRTLLVQGLKKLTASYRNVGLITYKSVAGVNTHFDEWLANALGIKLFGHFGALRGLDLFNDVDCLLIVGRHQIPLNEVLNLTYAFFGEVRDNGTCYANVPVRMKSGESMGVSNLINIDPCVEAVNWHFSRSETLQAIGRARLIHGKKKDVYYFSNESLGADVEVSRFFHFEDYFKKLKYQDAILRINTIGFCRNKPSALHKSLNISSHACKEDKPRINDEFLAAGITKQTIAYRDRHRNLRTAEYYVADATAFEDECRKLGAVVELKSIDGYEPEYAPTEAG